MSNEKLYYNDPESIREEKLLSKLRKRRMKEAKKQEKILVKEQKKSLRELQNRLDKYN